MKQIFALYKNAYSGLSPASWLLALVMFINRSGSMVMPFLGLYLTNELHFTIEKAGIIMSAFGLGSMAGSFLGGWLTDRFGQFRVQVLSLLVGGFIFLIVGYFKQFEWLLVLFFVQSMVADCQRPANAASIALYAKPENVTRAFSLNRMAINLGFSFGPAIGGLLAAISYHFLFITDGVTCIVAGLVFYFAFRNRKTYAPAQNNNTPENHTEKKSGWHDGHFLLFIICCFLFAMVFFQLFFTLPLYYRETYNLSEIHIGMLMALNGVIVFLFEMVIVYLIGQKYELKKLIAAGTLLSGLSFIILNMFTGVWILYVSMLILSFSEILAMPFMVTYTVERSGIKNKGSYMGLYSLSYATAFVVAPFLGTRLISHEGFNVLFWSAGLLAVFTAAGFYFVMQHKNKTMESI